MNRQTPNKRKQKIVIIGYSLARGSATEIKHKLGENCEVIGYVQPGSRLEEITRMARMETEELTSQDMVVIWGGANNIAKNESDKGLEYISNYVKQRLNTNITLVEAPQRYDLPMESCVNEEVKRYNRKLCKMMKIFENVQVVGSEVQRTCHTRHGEHMNGVGKEIMAQRIVNKIKEIVMPKMTPPTNTDGMETW